MIARAFQPVVREVVAPVQREYEATSIEARSQRIVQLLDERAKVFEQELNAVADGEKIPPQADERFKQLTRQIDREYAG